VKIKTEAIFSFSSFFLYDDKEYSKKQVLGHVNDGALQRQALCFVCSKELREFIGSVSLL
jgi:hypothetical protein